MKKTFIAIICSMLMLLTNTLHAQSKLDPDKCPSIEAIKALGLNWAEEIDHQVWAVGHSADAYDTNMKWVFYMGKFPAKNRDDAISVVGKIALMNLKFFHGPEKIAQRNGSVFIIPIIYLQLR